jgi:hypothetical protein
MQLSIREAKAAMVNLPHHLGKSFPPYHALQKSFPIIDDYLGTETPRNQSSLNFGSLATIPRHRAFEHGIQDHKASHEPASYAALATDRYKVSLTFPFTRLSGPVYETLSKFKSGGQSPNKIIPA